MTTEERIEKLERELGRAKRRTHTLLAGFALLAVAVAGLWAVDTLTTPAEAQQAAGVPRTIRAGEFVLVDSEGRTCARLGTGEDNYPRLVLFDERGTIRLALTASEDNSGLTLLDSRDRIRALLTAREDEAALTLVDPRGKLRAGIGVVKPGPPGRYEPILSLRDAREKVIWRAP